MATVISDWTKLGAILRSARRRQGLSQTQLAERAGVSRSWLIRLEGGHRGAELEPIFRLLSAMEIRLLLDEPSQTSAEDDSSKQPAVKQSGQADKRPPKRVKRPTSAPKLIPTKRLPRPRRDATPVESALDRQIDAALARRQGWLLAAEKPTITGHPVDPGSTKGNRDG